MSENFLKHILNSVGTESNKKCPNCNKNLWVNKNNEEWCDDNCQYGWDKYMKEVCGIKND